MEKEKKLNLLVYVYETLKAKGDIATKKDFAKYLDCSYNNLIMAFKGEEKYLNNTFIKRVQDKLEQSISGKTTTKENERGEMAINYTIPLLPIDSIAGSLTDFNADGIAPSQCEFITSPIKDATFAIRVQGDSMQPEYPNGSTILIKQVKEEIFIEWGCPYVLDTENGVVVKIVQPVESNDDIIECNSINPLYKPFRISKKYIRGWYRVLMVMALK